MLVNKESSKPHPKLYPMDFVIKINLYCVIFLEIRIKYIVRVIFNGNPQLVSLSLSFYQNFNSMEKIQK